MATLTATAAVFGANGDIVYTGVAAPADQLVQSSEITDTANVAELKNGQGEIVGLGINNKVREITIDFIPVGTTLADAKAALKLPAIPSKVTTTNFDHADYNGDWVYAGGGKVSLNNEGFTKMTLPLKQYLTSPKTATNLTTAVS